MALSDDHDPWVQMRLAKGLWQAQRHDRVSGAEILRLATAGGHAALGRAALALPAVGATADFVLVDVRHVKHLLDLAQWSVDDIVVAATARSDVAEVWVMGHRVHQR